MNAINRFFRLVALVMILTVATLVGITAYAYNAAPDAVNAAICEITTTSHTEQWQCRMKHNL